MLPPDDPLFVAAVQARTHARSKYSKFSVGAALETQEGKVYSGCNIENVSFGLTLCAERVALVKALSEGARQFTRIAIVTESKKQRAPTPPCGPCRQLLWEYCGDIEVVMLNIAGLEDRRKLSELFPYPFDESFL
jgi:cytidine deaminase